MSRPHIIKPVVVEWRGILRPGAVCIIITNQDGQVIDCIKTPEPAPKPGDTIRLTINLEIK